ncbi:hypothetical protein VPH35_129022 [Triticum aestivum]
MVAVLHGGAVRRHQHAGGLLLHALLHLRLRGPRRPLRHELPRHRRRRRRQTSRRARRGRLGALRQGQGRRLLVVHHGVLPGRVQQHARRRRAAAGRHVRQVGAGPDRADRRRAGHPVVPAPSARLRAAESLGRRRRLFFEYRNGPRRRIHQQRRRPSAAHRAGVAQRRRGGPGRGSGATHRWKEDPAVADGEHRGDEAGEEPQCVRQRPRRRLGVHRLQVAHRHAGHRDGLAAGHVQDRHRDVHVQHGVVHGAARENRGVRRGPGGAGDGAALRCGPTRGARRSRGVRPPRRRATLRHHTGSTTAINCLLRLRKGVWPPRRCT